MKDPEYPEYVLKEGDCHTCILYKKSNNSCKHKFYHEGGILHCISNHPNGNGMVYKPGLKLILKKL